MMQAEKLAEYVLARGDGRYAKHVEPGKVLSWTKRRWQAYTVVGHQLAEAFVMLLNQEGQDVIAELKHDGGEGRGKLYD